MKQDKTKVQTNEETNLTVIEPQNLEKPKQDTEFAKKSAELLVDIIEKNRWARSLGGQSKHIQYEGWQTAGKYYGYSVKTKDAEYVEFGNSWGFKAKATVVNEHTGIEVGGAEAYCMNDERNWSNKPKFQLASMAQTRAGSKALRQILGFVIALAGYEVTPLEEMTHETIHYAKRPNKSFVEPLESPTMPSENEDETPKITINQQKKIYILLKDKNFSHDDLKSVVNALFKKNNVTQLTVDEADKIIHRLEEAEAKITDKDYNKIEAK